MDLVQDPETEGGYRVGAGRAACSASTPHPQGEPADQSQDA